MSRIRKSSSFKISSSEYGAYINNNATIDENLASKYPESVVKLAKMLKAKNGDSFTDEYYLEYAQKQTQRVVQGTIGVYYKNKCAALPVQDSAWASYSYEEILQMENDGYNIPEEILSWAHAQQQSDITDYIVLTESTDSAENSNTEAVTGADELSQLQKVAKENILKVDTALDKSEQKKEEYDYAAKMANRVKKQNEKSYQETLQKIESDTKEWKKLDDKKRSGEKLSFSEKIRYAALSKKMLSSSDGLTEDIVQNNTKLESYLETLDGIQKDIEIDTQLATDTIQSGKDLSNYAEQYSEFKKPNVTSGVRFDGSGLYSESLYNVSKTDIASLAVEKGDTLNQNVQSISEIINSSNGLELTDFAQSYVNLVQEVSENRNNINNDEESENSDENSEQTKGDKSKKKSTNYDVAMIFSAINSQVSTAITLAATTNLLNKNKEAKIEEKTLQNLLKKSEKETQNVSKEASETEQVEMQNQTKEEEFLTQLENIQTDNGEIDKVEDNESKKEELVQNIENKENDNSSAKTKLVKQIQKGQLSTDKTNNIQGLLNTKNQELIKINNNASQVAAKTIVVGTGTVAKSLVSAAIGSDLYITGLSLSWNMWTAAEGRIMMQEGMAFMAQGVQEFNTGTVAALTGTAGLVTSAIAAETSTKATRSIKDALASVKDSKNEFRMAAKTGENQGGLDITNIVSPDGNNTRSVSNNENSQYNVFGENTSIEVNQINTPVFTANTSEPDEEQTTKPSKTSRRNNTANTLENTVNSENPETPDVTDTSEPDEEQTTKPFKAPRKNDTTTDTTETADTSKATDNSETSQTSYELGNSEVSDTTKTTDTTDTTETTDTSKATDNSETSQTSYEPGNSEVSDTTKTTDTTDTTEISDTTENSEETTQTESETSTEDTQTVRVGFGVISAVNATNTTKKATSQMVNQKHSVETQSSKVKEETKRSSKIIEEIERETSQAEAEHEVNEAEAQTIKNQINSEQSVAENSENTTVAANAETKAGELSTNLDDVIEQDEEVTEPAEDSITSGIKQLAKYQKNTSNLQGDISELNAELTVQLKDSANATVVGLGTTALGIFDTIRGDDMIATGVSLLASPLTASMGTTLIAIGSVILTNGIAENTAGIVATVTGVEGNNENSVAKNSLKEAQTDANSSTIQMRAADKSIQNAVSELLSAEEMPENDNSEIDSTAKNSENEETEDDTTATDETTLAAAATVGVDSNALNTTDDNNDKKLSRFNSDSIIHSKKKNKKVVGVSASMTNKKGKN